MKEKLFIVVISAVIAAVVAITAIIVYTNIIEKNNDIENTPTESAIRSEEPEDNKEVEVKDQFIYCIIKDDNVILEGTTNNITNETDLEIQDGNYFVSIEANDELVNIEKTYFELLIDKTATPVYTYKYIGEAIPEPDLKVEKVVEIMITDEKGYPIQTIGSNILIQNESLENIYFENGKMVNETGNIGPLIDFENASNKLIVTIDDDFSYFSISIAGMDLNKLYFIEKRLYKKDIVENYTNLTLSFADMTCSKISITGVEETSEEFSGSIVLRSNDQIIKEELDTSIKLNCPIYNFNTNKIYTNITEGDIYLNYSKDGLVYDIVDENFAISEDIVLDVNEYNCKLTELRINPSLNNFPFYMLNILEDGKQLYHSWGEIPTDNTLKFYTNSTQKTLRVDLSEQMYDINTSVIKDVYVYNTSEIGTNSYVRDIYVTSRSNYSSVIVYISDEDSHHYRYWTTKQEVNSIDYSMEIKVYKDDIFYDSFIFGLHENNFIINLPNGSYIAEVLPVGDNSIFQETSKFNLSISGEDVKNYEFNRMISEENDVEENGNISTINVCNEEGEKISLEGSNVVVKIGNDYREITPDGFGSWNSDNENLAKIVNGNLEIQVNNKIKDDIFISIASSKSDFDMYLEYIIKPDELSEEGTIKKTINLGDIPINKLIVNNNYFAEDGFEYYIFSNEYSDENLIYKSNKFHATLNGYVNSTDEKIIYTNVQYVEVYLLKQSNNNIMVDYKQLNLNDNHIVFKVDDYGEYVYTININPELEKFKYLGISMEGTSNDNMYWADICLDKEVKIYSNSNKLNNNYILSQFENDRGANLIEFTINNNLRIAYGTYISDVNLYILNNGSSNIYAIFKDNSDNEFNFIDYYYRTQTVYNPYLYTLKIMDEGEIIHSKAYNSYNDDFIEILPDGTYDVIVSPTYSNELFTAESYFKLIVNNNNDQPYKFEYVGNNIEE